MTSISAGIEPRQLRPYQLEAAAAVEADWAAGFRRVGVVLPTGAGKSTVIGKLVSDAYHRGQRVVMLAHRGELIDQMIRDLKAVDPSIPASAIGIVRAELNDHRAPIVGATLQTLGTAYRRRALGKRDLIIWDEVHHAGAEGWHATFEQLGGYEDALMAGFTATMHRSGQGRIGLGDVIEKVSYEKPLRWAIDEGFLVQPQGLTVRIENLNALNDVRNVAGDFNQREMADIMEAATEYVVDAIKLHAADRKPIIFGASVAASKAICDAINASGVMTAEYTEGGHDERKSIYERFRSGETQALVTCMILTEGADFPMCDSVVLARPTRSPNLYSQMVGRALRLYPGKTDALVLDLSGSSRHMRLVSLTELDPGAPIREVNQLGELIELTDEFYDDEPAERIRARRQGPVDMVSIDLFDGAESSETVWLETPAGIPFISIMGTKEIVALWPENNTRHATRWAVGRINTTTGSAAWVDGEHYRPVTEAAARAEEYITDELREALPKRTASWRRSQAPSEAQMRIARGLHIPGYEGMTKAALSDEISVKFASRVLDKFMDVSA